MYFLKLATSAFAFKVFFSWRCSTVNSKVYDLSCFLIRINVKFLWSDLNYPSFYEERRLAFFDSRSSCPFACDGKS